MADKGIRAYLVLVFGVGLCLAAAGVLWSTMPETLRLVFTLVMLVLPGVAVLAARRLGDRRDLPRLDLWPLPPAPALAALFGIPAAFALIAALQTVAGWAVPVWSLDSLMLYMPSAEQLNRSEPLQPSTVATAYFILTVLAGPTFFALLFLAGEIGWRDFFMARLLPAGRARALLVSALLWALWLTLLGLTASPTPAEALPGLVLHQVIFGTAFGAFVGEVWRRRRHVGLAAVCTGAMQAQVQGLWTFLFPEAPYIGMDWTASAFWALAAVALAAWPSRDPMPEAAAPRPTTT